MTKHYSLSNGVHVVANSAEGPGGFRETAPETIVHLDQCGTAPLARLAFTSKQTCHLLGGISLRSLKRLEKRGLLLPSRGLRTKLYALTSIRAYLEATL